MKRATIALCMIVASSGAIAQQPRLTQRQREHVAALGAALARCHGQGVLRLAHTPLSVPQITERVLAGCAAREAPIRAEVVRVYGAANAPRLIAAQRQHYRQGIAQMVAQARAAH